MKHKLFDSIKPYGYFLVRKSDNMKYVGIRYANVKYNLTPSEDFGKVYFTSGRLEKEFKKNPENFWFRFSYTFDTLEELFEWERGVALRVYKRPDWANQGWGQNYGDNPIIGQLISEGKSKVGPDGKTSIERGAEKLKDWIWNTEEGESWRSDISERVIAMRSEWPAEKLEEIQNKRKQNMDFKAAALKASQVRKQVGEDGLTSYERASLKAHETKLKNNTYEQQGKVFSEWVWNTEEGEEYRNFQSNRMKQYFSNLSEEEKEQRKVKFKNTLSERPSEVTAEIVERVKEIRSVVGEDGLNSYERAAAKTVETRIKNGTDKVASKKRGELFNKKLGEMSEEEFELYCANYRPRLAKSFRTRRNKYLEKVKVD